MINKGAETLKGKDVQAYKSLAKFHDTKNYKKGLKNAEKLLETNPDHPETLAMKALFESSLGEEEKALDTAKNALFKSKFMSILCWHTYGTLWKGKKNWEEAAKCFQNASKLDQHNLQLLREVASLSIQVRDHTGHLAARYKLLQEKPNIIYHWVSFVLAYHLKGDYPGLFKALGSLDNLVKGVEMKPVQLSHYYLYRVLAFRDAENYEGMHNQLTKNANLILDKTKWREHMLFCAQKLGKHEEAKTQMTELLKQFPENLEYLTKYQEMIGETESTFYRRISQQFTSKISKIMELRYTEKEDDFKAGFSSLIKPYFQKNLPSLFREIQVLYSSQEKEKWIGEIFQQFQVELSGGKYPDGEEMVSPSEHLWAMFLLGQHYGLNFKTLDQAYQYLTKAIQHTNTVPEMYIVKADIEYKLHNNMEALKTINEARKMDLADRYMNNICVKYLMKCRKLEIAQDVLRLFMKDEANLYQLQNQWYIIEAGKSFLEGRNYGPGLKHLDFIQKQFLQMYGNQYDFHTYCIRKWTLSQYVELIHYNDNIYQDKKFIEAAGTAIPHLFEYNHQLQQPNKEELSSNDKQEEKAEGKKKNKKKKKPQTVEVEELKPIDVFRKKLDYYGQEYLQSLGKQPLKEALTYATNVASARYVNKQNKNQNKLYFKAFAHSIDVFIAFNKPLMVIKALKKLLKTGQSQFDTHIYTLKSIIFLSKTVSETKDELIKEFVIDYIKERMGQPKNVEQYHQKVIQTWKASELQKIKCEFKVILVKECDVVLKHGAKREEFIQLYRAQLAEYIKAGAQMEPSVLEQLFYVVHRLEFYGEFTSQMKDELNGVLGQRTKYFSNWHEKINQLPPSTWSIWWLSEYDQQREELDFKQKDKDRNQTKEGDSSQTQQAKKQ